ncbi:MAG TPA: hypothetical protein VIE89_21845 [Candidatus Binatia bacterium]
MKSEATRISISTHTRPSVKSYPVAEYNGCCTTFMVGLGIRRWLIAAVLLILFGCASAPPVAFQNNSHRQTYSLNLEDLAKLQFYISRDVVAQYQDATGTKSLLLARMTPGVATGAGPNWIKVSFREGGVDVPFVTDPNQYDGRYWIATEVEGTHDFKKIADLPEKFFVYKGVRYQLVSGSDAILLMDWDGWKKVVETRKVTEGRRTGGN